MPKEQRVQPGVVDGDLLKEMTIWRRAIHAYPETAYEEHKTSAFVADRLREFGLAVHTGLAGTGVVGTLRAGSGARAIGLRADLDALDIQELNEFEHRSVRPGKMHACGHDGHTAMLLGAARHLAESKGFDGTINFIFQPAEENEGGARRMIEDGLFSRFPMDTVYGMHNLPGLPVGRFRIITGPALASFDTFEIVVKGKGGHAAMPQQAADPVVAGAHLVTALQTIVSRSVAPTSACVLSVTEVHAGSTWNVIPDELVIRGSVRALNEQARETIETRLGSIADAVVGAFGASASIRYERRYPLLVNCPQETVRVREVVSREFGPDAIESDAGPLMASDDFAYLQRERPGCFVLVGNGTGSAFPLHNPRYDFNDAVLALGAAYWVKLAEALLSRAD